MAALRRKFYPADNDTHTDALPSPADSTAVEPGVRPTKVTAQRTAMSYSDIAENVLWVLERGQHKGKGEDEYAYNQLMGDEVYEQLHVVADKNGDGFVNEAELAAFVEDVYSFVDLNEDGMVDDYELNNFAQVEALSSFWNAQDDRLIKRGDIQEISEHTGAAKGESKNRGRFHGRQHNQRHHLKDTYDEDDQNEEAIDAEEGDGYFSRNKQQAEAKLVGEEESYLGMLQKILWIVFRGEWGEVTCLHACA